MASLVDRKVVVLGMISIFGLTIIITIVLIGFSSSEEIDPNLSNLNFFEGNSGSSSSSSDMSLQSNNENKNARTFTLVMDDFGFNGSTSGPLIEVNKGDLVKINLINAGAMSHTFGMGKFSNFTTSLMNNISGLENDEIIQRISYDTLEAMPCPNCDTVFHRGHVATFIQPGHMVVTSFNASEAGSFKYFCMVRGHLWMGMNGPLVVNEINPSIQPGRGGELAV